jgi:hypothetical protein
VRQEISKADPPLRAEIARRVCEILQWVDITGKPKLASKILSLAIKQLKVDMPHRYGYSPVLLETFVDTERFEGTCYRAVNWITVGRTTGRSRGDRFHNAKIPVKEVYLYPLRTPGSGLYF